MEYRRLGRTDVEVSVICLGTMTWGEQNTEAEAHQQLDYAVDHGVNFIDTAEMYPVPPRAETQGLTEAYIGTWLKANPQQRPKVILASKVAGPSEMTYLRGGPQLTRDHIEKALHDSLERLQTDYIDLYQVHWPARRSNYFGRLGYVHEEDDSTPIEETLDALEEFVQAGKIRHIGVSNETAWGTMRWIAAATASKQSRIVSIQNPYSLLTRMFEVGSAEVAHREDVGLLAYSPLGFGVLSGKYLDDSAPSEARLKLFGDWFVRYSGELGTLATKRYVEIARAANLDPAQLALAYVNTRSFVTSNIIGATTMSQLADDIASVDIRLTDDVLEQIEQVHTEIPNPCP